MKEPRQKFATVHTLPWIRNAISSNFGNLRNWVSDAGATSVCHCWAKAWTARKSRNTSGDHLHACIMSPVTWMLWEVMILAGLDTEKVWVAQVWTKSGSDFPGAVCRYGLHRQSRSRNCTGPGLDGFWPDHKWCGLYTFWIKLRIVTKLYESAISFHLHENRCHYRLVQNIKSAPDTGF